MKTTNFNRNRGYYRKGRMLTARQLFNIATGMRKIREKANFAINSWYAGYETETGTYLSKRGPRTYRGREV